MKGFLTSTGISVNDADKRIERNENDLNVLTPNIYLKDSVIVTTPSNSFSSNVPVDVPGLTYTITQDGDYTFYTIINRKKKASDEADIFFAKNGITILDSESTDNEERNKVKSAQNMFIIDNLSVGDVITVRMDTNGSNIDLNNRRLIIQSWG
jgi:hypothetical protein